MKKNISILLALAMALNPIVAKASDFQDYSKANNQQIVNEQGIEVAEPYKSEVIASTEENFVKNMAESKNISYEEAKAINDKNTFERNEARIPQFTTEYSTKKQYYKINSKITLVMATEIKFIRDNFSGGAQIATVGAPYMDISAVNGASMSRWSGGGFNVEYDVTKARISTTGQAYVEISNSVSSGFDFAGLTFSASADYGKIYSTGVKTYVMNISASSL